VLVQYARAEITDLTIANGSDTTFGGGAVLLNGAYGDFRNVRFENNKTTSDGGAVLAAAPGAVFFANPIGTGFYDCDFVNNKANGDGGGAWVSGFNPARVVGSTFTGNVAGGDGGGLFSDIGGVDAGQFKGVYIAQSTFANNTAGGFGGGVAQNSGLIDFFDAIGPAVTLDRVTITGNTAKVGGGVYADGFLGPLRVDSSTIVGNTATGKLADPVNPAAGALPAAGGIHTPSYTRSEAQVKATVPAQMVILNNSIVAGNATVGGAGQLYADVRGSYLSNGKNLFGVLPITTVNGKDPAFAIVRTDPGFINSGGKIPELFGTPGSPLSPQLGPLQDNGGLVPTMSPLPGSRVIDAGGVPVPGSVAGSDARNLVRVAGAGLDLGAYEVQDATVRVGLADIPLNTLAVQQIGGADNPGAGQATSVRLPFARPFQARVVDRFGNPVAGAAVTFDATAGGVFLLRDGVAVRDATGRPVPVTVRTDADGLAQVQGIAGVTVGTFDVVVSTPGQQQTAALRATVLTDAPLARVTNLTATLPRVFFSDPQTPANSGNDQAAKLLNTYGQKLSVLVRDFTGGPAPAGTVVVFQVLTGVPGFIFPDGTQPGVGGVTFNGGSRQYVQAVTDAQGVASVTVTADTKLGAVKVAAGVLAFNSKAGFPPQLPGSGVTFTSPVILNPVLFTLTNTVGDPAGVTVVVGSGQTTAALEPVGQPLRVVVRDLMGNPVANVPVTFTAPPAAGATVSLYTQLDPVTKAPVLVGQTATVTTNAAGEAQVSAVANGATGAFAVTAAVAGVPQPASFALTNRSGEGSQVLIVSGSGQSAGVGAAFADPLRVRVLDAAGNPAAGALVTFAGAAGGPGVVFPAGATALTDADGFAQVAVAANTRAGQTAVSASVPRATASFTLTNLVADPATLTVLSGGGQTAAAGTTFASPLVFAVQDQFGNPIPGVTPTITTSGATGASATAVVTPTDATGVGRAVLTANRTAGTFTVRVAAGNLAQTVSLTNTPAASTGPGDPQVGLPSVAAVGTGTGTVGVLSTYTAAARLARFTPFDPGFAGGVRTAVARTPTDTRVLAVPGPGRFPDARLFDAGTGAEVSRFQPFETGFTGGLYAAAGDIDRDGFDDFAVSPDEGGGPRVQIRSGLTGRVIQDFFAIDDPNFRGGARVALADVNGDQVPDLVVSAGFGGGPRVAVFDGASLAAGQTPRKLVGDFFAFEPSLRNGVYVAAGDLNADGRAEVVLGAGPGGAPRVLVLDGQSLLSGRQVPLADFFDGDMTSRGGVRVAVKDLGADGTGDLLAGSGSGDGSRVNVYAGRDLRAGLRPPVSRVIDDLGGFAGGVFVG
jgi:hypothetical protein